MTNLDDQAVYQSKKSLPTAVQSIAEFPKQLAQALSESTKIEFPAEYGQVKNIVVCGMGGSRFTPWAVRELYKEQLKVPYAINDNYTLPGYVNENSLVILSSYSGTTEEVVTCGETALKLGAKVSAVTIGGRLTEMLGDKYPHYVFDPTHNPSGQPRIGGGYMIGGHIGIMIATGLIDIQASEVEKAIEESSIILQSYTIDTPKSENSAKQLAKLIYHKYPYIITSEFLQGAGNMMANALNETAKNISSPRFIPEINHHLMEGLQYPKELKRVGLFVFFFSKLYHERIQKRYKLTQEIVEKNNLATHWHELQGSTKTSQLFEAIGFASYVTLYLAVLYNKDPNSIPFVD